jgi:hypothetical protein
VKAEIWIGYKNSGEAEAIAKAVSPDNLKTPSGLKVRTFRKGRFVVTLIECKQKLETFIATIDDLLSCIQTAEKTLGVVRKHA